MKHQRFVFFFRAALLTQMLIATLSPRHLASYLTLLRRDSIGPARRRLCLRRGRDLRRHGRALPFLKGSISAVSGGYSHPGLWVGG